MGLRVFLVFGCVLQGGKEGDVYVGLRFELVFLFCFLKGRLLWAFCVFVCVSQGKGLV